MNTNLMKIAGVLVASTILLTGCTNTDQDPEETTTSIEEQSKYDKIFKEAGVESETVFKNNKSENSISTLYVTLTNINSDSLSKTVDIVSEQDDINVVYISNADETFSASVAGIEDGISDEVKTEIVSFYEYSEQAPEATALYSHLNAENKTNATILPQTNISKDELQTLVVSAAALPIQSGLTSIMVDREPVEGEAVIPAIVVDVDYQSERHNAPEEKLTCMVDTVHNWFDKYLDTGFEAHIYLQDLENVDTDVIVFHAGENTATFENDVACSDITISYL